MQNRLYIFNPENDLALAFGGENYTAPPLATRLRSDLQLLPVWYSEPEAAIYAENSPSNNEWFRNLRNNLNIEANIVDEKSLGEGNFEFLPWGWSADMRKRMIDKGVDCKYLPTANKINEIRNLSHRSVSVRIHEKVREILGMELSPIPVELRSFEDVREFATRYPECFIKAPWSSSGKGIFRVLDRNAIDFERRCRGIIKQQGSILCEVPLDKILDFAMEFYIAEGLAKFVGYSVFKNDNHCSFDSGMVASADTLKAEINSYLQNTELIDKIRNSLEVICSEIIGDSYTGYFGIDMLLYREGNEVKVNPCVELNLRMTMGAVTSIIGERYLAENTRGTFRIEYHRTTESLRSRVEELMKDVPVYENNKIKGGTQLLVPPYNESRYCAYVKVED